MSGTRERRQILPAILGRFLLTLTLLAVATQRVEAQAEDRATPPNIVFILADDLGVHDLGCYGRADHRTPRLDRLASEGTRFTSAYCAQPICSPSRAAILTGLAPARLHLTTFLPGRADATSQRVLHPIIRQQLPLESVTLAERLRAAGYATACIGKWHLGGARFGPEHQGFDVVHPGQANTPPGPDEGGKGEYGLTRKAMEFVANHRDRPFFLYLSHNTPHIPYAARPDLVERNAAAFEPTYAAVMESMDDAVGQLLDHLDRLDLRQRTLVIFTSDNGGLHVPELRHSRITHNGPYRAGKGFLYEGGLRVPLLARWPGRILAGRSIDAPVVNTDWLPTLLELAGIPPGKEPIDGRSFAPLLVRTASPGRSRPLHWHFPHYTNQGGRPGGATREGRWKLVEFYDTGDVELYDLESDPGESRNLASRHPRLTRRLRSDLAAWRTRLTAQTNRPNPHFESESFHALYADPDPSRFRPAEATSDDWSRMAAWRVRMDAATARPLSDSPLPR